MKTMIAVVIGLTASACVTATVTESFNAADGAYILKDGKGRIEGSAFMRQRGGAVVTAAGNTVTLTPVTPYSQARFNAIYKDRKTSYLGARIENTPDEYMKQGRDTKADVEGRFKFENLHPGDYFINTNVRWEVPGGYLPEGGLIYERVTVKNGETANVVLSGN